jgi:CBS domain-containing protein
MFTALASIFSLTCSFSANRVFVSTPALTHRRLVQDCMTPNPVCLKTTDTVDDAIHRLLLLGFNGAPVVDPASNNLVGVISAFDFLQKEEGGTLLPMQGSEEEMSAIMHAAQRICATTVGDLMTPIAATIPPTMTMREASEYMIRDRCHRLCVVDEAGHLLGILATSDIMRDVLKVVRQALPESGGKVPELLP